MKPEIRHALSKRNHTPVEWRSGATFSPSSILFGQPQIITLWPGEIPGPAAKVSGREADWNPETEFLPWAFTVARFTVLGHVRDQMRDRLVFDEEGVLAMETETQAAAGEFEDRRDALSECMKKLRAEQRGLLHEHYIEDPRPTLQQYFICMTVPEPYGDDKRGRGDLSGILFQNISIAAPSVLGEPQLLWGQKDARIRNLTFENMTLGGKPVTSADFFKSNEFVDGLIFAPSAASKP